MSFSLKITVRANEFPMTIILVDDHPAVRDSLKLRLVARGHCVADFGTAAEAIDAALATPRSSLIADYLMPGMNGIDLLKTLRARGWQGSALLITGHFDPTLASRAGEAGYLNLCEKPICDQCLADAVACMEPAR